MSAPSSCPPADRLRQLLAEPPTADAQADLVAHVGDCARCQQALEELAGANPALLKAATALPRTEFQEEAPFRRVLDHLESEAGWTQLHPLPDRKALLQALLRPAAALGALGQLADYEVTELLGQGGMGVVLKAFDRGLKRWVAIKVLAPDLAGDLVARQRFAREAQAAAAVRHLHVVTIHAVSEANGLPFLVMEYVAGGSLQEYLDSHAPPDWRAVARLGAEVASGLAAAHAHNLVHRDIKPSNILLQTGGSDHELGTAKIGDFGLARVVDDARLTRTGIIPGTPMYMSPEQSLCEPLDGRADLFSLGSVLYALCTGREPFPAGSPVAVLRQVCEATPRPIRELNPAIPDWLAATVERLHAKQPADRFASAAEVAELLRYNLEHPDQPRLPLPPRSGPRLRRHRRRLLLGVLLAGLLLVGGLLLGEAFHWAHLAGEGGDGGVPLRATLRGHDGPVMSMAFAPDGRLLATGSDDTSLRLWDAATGKQQAVLPGHSSAVVGVAFAHSGEFLVSGDSDGTLRLWNVATRDEGPALPHHQGNLRRLALSPDDRTLAVGGGAQGVELWDLETRSIRQTLAGRHGSVFAIAFAPDGQTLATGDANGSIHLWDPATGTERATFRADSIGLRALTFAPDSKTLASAGTGDKDVKRWRVSTQERVATFDTYANPALNLAISPDGHLLATGSRDGTVKVWDVSAARVLATLRAHQGSVLAVAFAPDGRTLATAGEDHFAKLWDLDGLTTARP
jgi:WD40 repeat protein/tRNA A-37 threonylcarbamoyl transferase component Bud32